MANGDPILVLSYEGDTWIWDFSFAHFVCAILNIDPGNSFYRVLTRFREATKPRRQKPLQMDSLNARYVCPAYL